MLVHHFETFLSTLSFSPLRKFFLQHFIFSIQEIQTKTEAGKKMAAASFIDFKSYRDFKKIKFWELIILCHLSFAGAGLLLVIQ